MASPRATARIGISKAVEHEWRTDVPVITLGRAGAMVLPPIPAGAEPGSEGYRIVSRGGANPAVYVGGADERGVLFGAGRLLRELRMTRGVAGTSLLGSLIRPSRFRAHLNLI